MDAGVDGSVEWRTAQGLVRGTADLVVGADGVHSTLRAAGDFGAAIRPTGERYLRALVPRRPDTPLQGEFWTSLGLLGGAPVDEDTQYLHADATAPEVTAALDAADLGGLVRAWGGVLPAAVLVIEVGAGRPVAEALERYERRRRPAVLGVQCRADAVARLASIRSGVSRDARDLVLRALDHVPGVTARAAHDLQQEDPAELADAVGVITAARP